jgi:hypothetical protein
MCVLACPYNKIKTIILFLTEETVRTRGTKSWCPWMETRTHIHGTVQRNFRIKFEAHRNMAVACENGLPIGIPIIVS